VTEGLFNEPAGFANTGIPVAGNFDGNAVNGDEVGVFTGSAWRFDTDHDFSLADEKAVASNMTGFPVVGDFDGDGADDPGTWDVSGNRFYGCVVQFCPAPFGADLFARFGNQFGVPLLGNFDPPGGAVRQQSLAVTTSQPVAALERRQSDTVVTQQPVETIAADPAGEPGTLEVVQADEDPASDVVQHVGTPEDDAVLVVPASRVVEVNGVWQQLEGNAVTVAFDGLGGDDSLTVVGSGDDEAAVLWPDRCVFIGPSLSLVAENVESTTVVGGGGNDTATLYDSPGDDRLEATPDAANLQGNGFSVQALGFSTVTAHATQGGTDVASLHDSVLAAYPDHLEAKVDSSGKWARVSNAPLGYAIWAYDFNFVEATSSNPEDTKDVASAVDFLVAHGYW
jgi:hypothetical protein